MHLDTNICMPLLEAVNISHDFDYPLFSNINFTLNSNETVAIIGPSGCGKSTFLNILSSLLEPTKGSVIYDKKNIYEIAYEDVLEIRKNDFGIIFQSHYLFRGFNASQNLKIAELISGQQISSDLLNRFGISHVMSQNIGELSGGQQQRVSIARVLAKNPKILFADEPTGNLDSQTANEVIDTLFEYTKNGEQKGLVMVTHEERLAKRCDRILKLENYELKEIK